MGALEEITASLAHDYECRHWGKPCRCRSIIWQISSEVLRESAEMPSRIRLKRWMW